MDFYRLENERKYLGIEREKEKRNILISLLSGFEDIQDELKEFVNEYTKDNKLLYVRLDEWSVDKLEQFLVYITKKNEDNLKLEEETNIIIKELDKLGITPNAVVRLIEDFNEIENLPYIKFYGEMKEENKRKNITKKIQKEQVILCKEITAMCPTNEEIALFCHINKLNVHDIDYWDYEILSRFKNYLTERRTKNNHRYNRCDEFYKVISRLIEITGYSISKEYLELLDKNRLSQIITSCINICTEEFDL